MQNRNLHICAYSFSLLTYPTRTLPFIFESFPSQTLDQPAVIPIAYELYIFLCWSTSLSTESRWPGALLRFVPTGRILPSELSFCTTSSTIFLLCPLVIWESYTHTYNTPQLGRFDRTHVIMDSYGPLVRWCPIVRCSILTKASNAKRCFSYV